MSFMQRPDLVILISTMLSYLPHGNFKGWISVNNIVVKFVKRREFSGFSFGVLKDQRISLRLLYYKYWNYISFNHSTVREFTQGRVP